MHRTDTERDMRELVRKGQEESLTTPTILDVREKGAAGAQSDGAGKGMQAGKPVLIGEGRMLQSPACPVGIAGMGGWIPWMSKKGWLQRRQGVQGLATAKETWREAGIARSSCSSGRCGGSHPEPFMSEEQRRTMAATPRKVGKALGCDSCPSRLVVVQATRRGCLGPSSAALGRDANWGNWLLHSWHCLCYPLQPNRGVSSPRGLLAVEGTLPHGKGGWGDAVTHPLPVALLARAGSYTKSHFWDTI